MRDVIHATRRCANVEGRANRRFKRAVKLKETLPHWLLFLASYRVSLRVPLRRDAQRTPQSGDLLTRLPWQQMEFSRGRNDENPASNRARRAARRRQRPAHDQRRGKTGDKTSRRRQMKICYLSIGHWAWVLSNDGRHHFSFSKQFQCATMAHCQRRNGRNNVRTRDARPKYETGFTIESAIENLK